MKFYENLNFLNFLKILKFYDFEILKFLIFFFEIFEILEFFWIFLNFEFFLVEFSWIDDEVPMFRIHIRLFSNPVAELKTRENDSHCRSIVLKTMDRSIVKLEKENNSNFNVENSVVMFIYWGIITFSVLLIVSIFF